MKKIKLIQLRLAKGLSQEELADLIGMTQSNYSRRENGRKNITEVEWVKIAKELDVKKEAIYEPDTKNIKDRDDINTNHYNIPDFLIEHLESLRKENNKLKEKLKKMKNQ